jgi:hypothetical protein
MWQTEEGGREKEEGGDVLSVIGASVVRSSYEYLRMSGAGL